MSIISLSKWYYLIPQLEVFTGQGREIVFAFDNDGGSKPETVARVNQALERTAALFEQKGSSVSVMSWDDVEGKGVDDLIANRGEAVFLEHLKSRQPFGEWLDSRQPKPEILTCKHPAREMDTKLGRRINAVFANAKGEDVTVWADPSHQGLRGLVRGKPYSVLCDGKGNIISVGEANGDYQQLEGQGKDTAESQQETLIQDSKSDKSFPLPERYRKEVEALANLPEEFSTERLKTALQLIRNIQFKIVADLSNELQVAVDGPKSYLRPDREILKACKVIGGYQPVAWLTGRDKSHNPLVYRTHTLETSNYSPVDLMVGVANGKWQENRLVARPVVQFRGFFPEPANPDLTEIAGEIKETYNHYLSSARALEDIKELHPELIEPYLEVTSSKSQKTIYLTRLDRFQTLESEIFSQNETSKVDLQVVANTTEQDIPNSLLAVAKVNLDGETVQQSIGAIAISSAEQHNLKAGIKVTQGLAILRPGITQGRVHGIYKALNAYVEMVRQEHPEGERQQLAAALWHNAHTKDDYRTKKALLAFKVFPDEVLQQLEQLQFTQLRAVGLHFPTNEYGNRQWRGEEVDCEIALHPIPNKSGELEQKRVIKVDGKVLAPLDGASPALAVGTKFRASILAEPSSGVVATTAKGNTLKIAQVKNFAYRTRDWQGEEEKIGISLVGKGKGRETPLVTLDGNALGVLDRESENRLRERNLLSSRGLTLAVRLENSPPTTARVQVKPETVIYPWQQREREREQESQRSVYREKYEAYRADILKDPSLQDASERDIDVRVAVRAYADTDDSYQVGTILSQGNQVREWRASVPSSLSWDEYVNQAKDYVRYVQDDARERLAPTPSHKQIYYD